MFRSVERQQSNRLSSEGNTKFVILSKPYGRLKLTTDNHFEKNI